MSKHKAIKEELFLIKKFLETSEGRKVRPDDYMNNRTFMSDVYPKLSKEVKNDLEYCLFKLHKSKTILNKLADSVIERSAEKGIDKNDNKEENKMSKKDNKKENVLVIGEQKKEKKKHKTTEDIDDIIKELKEMKSDDDTTKMAMEESKKEKKHKDSAKSEKSSKEDYTIEDIINELGTIVDEEDDEIEDDIFDEFEGDDKEDYDIDEEDDEIEEEDVDYSEYDSIVNEVRDYNDRVDKFEEANNMLASKMRNLKGLKSKYSPEEYNRKIMKLKEMRIKLEEEREYLFNKNLENLDTGKYACYNFVEGIKYEKDSKDWKREMKFYVENIKPMYA